MLGRDDADAAPTWTRRHLLDVDELSREDLEGVLDLAAELRARREAGELPDPLRGMPVGLAFFEASTRTRVSSSSRRGSWARTVTDLRWPAAAWPRASRWSTPCAPWSGPGSE